MSSNASFRCRNSFDRLGYAFKTQYIEKSSHSHSRQQSRGQMTHSMSKSIYTQLNTDQKRVGFHRTEALSSIKSDKNSQFVLKKHNNKKFNKLIALIAYTIASADKAIQFLDISCNFQAQFASKLYFSDRQTLLKELNTFSFDNLQQNKSIMNIKQTKSLIFQQSLLQQTKELRIENQRLKRQVIMLEIQLTKQQKFGSLQSKSTNNLITTQQIGDYSALLLTKSCQFDLLREQYDFLQMENKKIAKLLKSVCRFDQINEFLISIKQESKWRIQSLNTEHSKPEKLKYQKLAQASIKLTQELSTEIIKKMQNVFYAEKEKVRIEQEFVKSKKQFDALSRQFQSKNQQFSIKQSQFISRQQKYSDQIVKLSQYIARLEEKWKNMEETVIQVCETQATFCNVKAQNIEQCIKLMGSSIADFEEQFIRNQELQKKNALLQQEVKFLQQQNSDITQKIQNQYIRNKEGSQQNHAQKQRILSQFKQLKQLLASKEKQLCYSRSFFNEVKSQNFELAQKNRTLEYKMINLSSQLHQTQLQLSKLKQQLSEKQVKINDISVERNMLQNQIVLLQRKQSQNSQNEAHLTKQLLLFKQEKQRLKALLQSKQHQITNKQNDYQLAKQTYQIKMKEYEQDMINIRSIRDDLQNLLNDSRQKSTETMKTYQNLIAHLKQDNQIVKRQNSDIKKMIQKIQEDSKSKNSSEIRLKQEINHIVVQRDRLKQTINQLIRKLKEKQQTQQKLKKIISDYQLKNEPQSMQVIGLKKQKTQLLNKIEKYERQLLSLNQKSDQNLQIYNKNLQQIRISQQKWKIEKERIANNFTINQQMLKQEITKLQASKRLLEQKISLQKHILQEKCRQQQQTKNQPALINFDLNQAATQKKCLEEQVKALQHIIEMKKNSDQKICRQFNSQISRLYQQLAIARQRCKEMEVQIIAAKKHSDKDTRYRHELTSLQKDLMQRTAIHHRQWQQLSSALSCKQKQLNTLKQNYNKLFYSFKIQAQRLVQAQKTNKKKQNINIFEHFRQIPKKQQLLVDNGQNNFTDFGSFIQHKMGESFVSIVNSQANNNQQRSNVEEAFVQLPIMKNQTAVVDEFSDLCSSQAEEIMYSMSSHNQSVQHPIVTFFEQNILLPSTHYCSAKPILQQSKLNYFCDIEQEVTENNTQRCQRKLRRTYSIIRDEDPVIQVDYVPTKIQKKSSFKGAKDAHQNK